MTSLDIAEIIEIFELRMVLEQHAVAVATRMRTEADVEAVETLLLRMEGLDPRMADYAPLWLDLNREFHNRLIGCARRQRVSSITLNLRDTIEPYVRFESYLATDFISPQRDHRAIFEAFRNRAADRAGEVSRDHCLGTMNRLLDRIRHREPPGRGASRSSMSAACCARAALTT